MTLTIAIAGAILAAISFGWQIYTWRHDGPRVSVKAARAMPVGGHSGAGNWHLAVSAVNTGRAAAVITGWGLALPGGDYLVDPLRVPWTTPCPHRLDAQTSADFHTELDKLRRACAERGLDLSDLRPFVNLATGERVFGKALPRTTA
jgi:hypothetical protein